MLHNSEADHEADDMGTRVLEAAVNSLHQCGAKRLARLNICARSTPKQEVQNMNPDPVRTHILHSHPTAASLNKFARPIPAYEFKNNFPPHFFIPLLVSLTVN